MTKLEAVNEILEAVGEPPASALDTGGTSIEAEAEDTLDKIDKRIQKVGWAVNEQNEVTLAFANRKLTVGAVTGTYQYDETVTEATTGATGKFKYLDGTSLYLQYVSGTFDGATRVLTGGTSGATCTDSAVATTTSSKIAINTAWLKVTAHRTEPVTFVPHWSSGFLYDKDDNTFTFDADVKADIVTQLTWLDLTEALQEYIVKMARIDFQRFKKRGVVSDDLLKEELRMATYAVKHEDTDLRRTNLNKTPQARELLGRRLTYNR